MKLPQLRRSQVSSADVLLKFCLLVLESFPEGRDGCTAARTGHSRLIMKEASPMYRSILINTICDVMSQSPHAIAVTDGDLEWTYDTLGKKTDIVARNLGSHGISPGSVVGMHLPRCADAIATMLGIMASGCIYLPLDPNYPSARVRSMLDRAGAVAVISHDDNPDLYGSQRIWLPPPGHLTIEPDTLASELSIFSSEEKPFGPKDHAYILFTSGSTGEPKGVMVTHENITSMTEWSAKVLGFTQFDSSATTSSLSFDPSFHETLLPLSVGGTVHVIPHALALGQLNRQVSLIATTPTVANELVRAGLLPPLKVLMVGGEALVPDVAERLLSSGRVGRLFNCYGPTECTVCVTMTQVTAPVPEVIPIGEQVSGTEVHILDSNGQSLPDGQLGEICIFGRQVTDGYVNNPAATAERFLTRQDPAGAQRYYRTGDLGYRLNNGVTYFAGRSDRQVKINGHRIELAEIDAVLRSHPQISEGTTIIQDGNRIVSYVVPDQAGSQVDTADLKRHLAEKLPAFMLPAGLMVLAELPKTVNGKLDDSALPRWSPGRAGQEALDEALDIDDLTARVIQVVANVTGFGGQIYPSDDVVNDLGGTSLDIVRILTELQRYAKKKLRVSDALGDASVAGLRNLLSEDSVSPPYDFALNTESNAPPLFLLHTYFCGIRASKHLAELLPSDQPVYGLLIQSPSEQSSETLTVSSIAQDTLRRIRAIQPEGRIKISGHAVGGLVAFEVSRQLVEAGDPEPQVLLIDAVMYSSALGYQLGNLMLNWREYLQGPAKIFRAASRLISRRPAGTGRNRLLEASAESVEVDPLVNTNLLVKNYRAQSYNGDITIIRTRQGRVLAMGKRHLGLKPAVKGNASVITVPGAHTSMLYTPYVNFIAKVMTDWLSGH